MPPTEHGENILFLEHEAARLGLGGAIEHKSDATRGAGYYLMRHVGEVWVTDWLGATVRKAWPRLADIADQEGSR